MLTICDSCKKKLAIKNEADGKKVRCPHCKAIFIAYECADMEIAEPESKHPSLESAAKDTHVDNGESNWSFDEPDRPKRRSPRAENVKEHRANAIAAMRPAANAMLAALVLSLVAVALRIVPRSFFFPEEFSRDPLFACGAAGGVALYLLLFIFFGVATRRLYTAGSRGLIITGIVLGFLLVIDLAASMVPFLFSVLEFTRNPDKGMPGFTRADGHLHAAAMLVCPGAFFAGFALFVNLFAITRTISALSKEEVRQYYRYLKKSRT